VSGRHDVEAAVAGGAIEEVALERAARGARGPVREGGDGRDLEAAVLGGEVDDPERKAACGGERLDQDAGAGRVLADALRQVESGRVVPQMHEDVPERQTVLAAGDRTRTRSAGAIMR
jgi:hypothetical protein